MPMKKSLWPTSSTRQWSAVTLHAKEAFHQRMRGFDNEERRRALTKLAAQLGVPAAQHRSFVDFVVRELLDVAEEAASDATVAAQAFVENQAEIARLIDPALPPSED